MLSDAAYESIVGRSILSERTPKDARDDGRLPFHGRAVLVRMTGAKPSSVIVRDFSPHGVGLITSEELAVGERFTLRMQGQERAFAVDCIASRCERRRKPTGMAFSVGATFYEPPAVAPPAGHRLRSQTFAA